MTTIQPTCQVIRPESSFEGKQALTYLHGISAERNGARAIYMHMLTMPPGARARAHLHENHETAIYVISGQAAMWYGAELADHLVVAAGEMLYIPAGVPHLPYNPFEQPCTVVLSRTDPNEQESVVLLAELDAKRAS
jgi:uncharacterized RmlC-like cupin family protein